MNDHLRQALIIIGCTPFAYIFLKLIFKNSIMFMFSFYIVLFVLFVSYTSILIGKIGGYTMFWVIPLNFLIGIFVFLFIKKSLSKPLESAIIKLRELSEGNLNINVERVESKDELGILNNSLVNLSEQLKKFINELKDNGDNLISASQLMKDASEQLSQSASEQASSIEEVSSTMQEVSANIEQNSENARQTEKVSVEANDGLKGVAEKAREAIEANHNISEKITIIDDIAFQTNLLALNAAVEAARAGEHGRGFAVVAAEVRKLAENSKTAAEQIVNLVQSALKMTQAAGEVIIDTIPKIENTSRLVQEISAASIEQNSGVTQVNNTIQQLNNITQETASASEELASTAEGLSEQAERLKKIISFFKIEEQQTNALLKRDVF